MAGWVKLHRSLLDNPLSNKADYLSLWIHLLLLANHEPKNIIFNNRKMVIQKGQLITSRDSLAKKTRLHRSKIERILNYLEIEQQIEQQTNNKFRLITIKNWESYQQNEQQIEQPVSNQRATSGQPVSTNKKVKNIKNNKNDKNLLGSPKKNMEEFLKMMIEKEINQELYDDFCLAIALQQEIELEKVRAEIDKFVNHWTEKTLNGKHQKWETQKTFEVQKRLATWFSHAKEWGTLTSSSMPSI